MRLLFTHDSHGVNKIPTENRATGRFSLATHPRLFWQTRASCHFTRD